MSVDGIETEATKASREVTTYAAKVAEEIDKAHVTKLMANWWLMLNHRGDRGSSYQGG